MTRCSPRDGSLWFLMPVGEQRPIVPQGASAARRCRSATSPATSAGSGVADRATMSSSGPTATCAAPTSTAPGCRAKPRPAAAAPTTKCSSATGTRGRRRASASRLFGFALAGGKLAGKGAALTGSLVGDTPSKPFGGSEEIALSPDGRTVYFALREAGRIEPLSTNLDIFAVPTDGSAPPVNLTDANDGTDNLPTVSPDGRTLAYFAMARPGYEADRQVLMLRDLATGNGAAADPGVGPLGRLDRMGEGWQEPAGHRRGHARAADLPRRRGDRRGHAPDRRRPLRQCSRASGGGAISRR